MLRKLLLFPLLSEKTVLASVSGGFSLLVVPFFLTGLGMTKKADARNIQGALAVEFQPVARDIPN